MSPSVRELLLHILDETSYLLSASDQLNQVEFLADPTLKRAFTRSLEIIGEAVKSLPIALTDAQPQVTGDRSPEGAAGWFIIILGSTTKWSGVW
jgi:uncharacterized protein with HEPN domain